MTPNVIGVPEDASLWDALKLMVERKVSALIVLDGVNAPIGVLSEGDLMRRAEFGAEKRRPRAGWNCCWATDAPRAITPAATAGASTN